MVYERQKDNGLKLVQQVSEVATVADNFQLTPSGDALVVGAHPFHSQLAAHVNDPTNKAPSSVSTKSRYSLFAIVIAGNGCLVEKILLPACGRSVERLLFQHNNGWLVEGVWW